MNRERGFQFTAVLVFVLGLLLAARAIRGTAPVLARIQAMREDIRQLQDLLVDKQREDAAVAFYEKMPEHDPLSLREVLGAVFPGVPAEIRFREPKAVVAGWTARRVEVSFESVSLSEVSHALTALHGDGTRPPWQMMECQIKASDQTPGYGRVALTLRALEK